MKKIKVRHIILAIPVLLWLFLIFIPRQKTEFAMKKYVREYYGTENVKVEHGFLYGSYGIMNGNDNIRYRNGMIMDYQRVEDIKKFTKKCDEILRDMPKITDSYSYILSFFPLDDVHTPYHRLDMHLKNENNVSADESREIAIETIVGIIEKLNAEYNITGLEYKYYDKYACYEVQIKVDRQQITYEMIDENIKVS